MPTSDWLDPGTVVNADDGNTDWSNPSNAGDGTNATEAGISLPKNGASEYLECSNFTWPTGMTALNGIEFRQVHYADDPLSGIFQNTFNSFDSGGNHANQAIGEEWAAQTEETFTFGGPTDTLGLALGDLDSSAGCRSKVVGSITSARTGKIYYIQARVYYEGGGDDITVNFINT